jgi:hypothetical protein
MVGAIDRNVNRGATDADQGEEALSLPAIRAGLTFSFVYCILPGFQSVGRSRYRYSRNTAGGGEWTKMQLRR